MQQFGYMQIVPRDPFESAPPAMTRRDMGAMYEHYLNHLVSDETWSTIAPSDWSVAHGYIQWVFQSVTSLYDTRCFGRST